jgi:hypothetical protein
MLRLLPSFHLKVELSKPDKKKVEKSNSFFGGGKTVSINERKDDIENISGRLMKASKRFARGKMSIYKIASIYWKLLQISYDIADCIFFRLHKIFHSGKFYMYVADHWRKNFHFCYCGSAIKTGKE